MITNPSGPWSVMFGTPTSCNVSDRPGRPPMFFHVLLVMKMWSSLDSFTLCSCARRCVHSPQLNKYLNRMEIRICELIACNSFTSFIYYLICGGLRFLIKITIWLKEKILKKQIYLQHSVIKVTKMYILFITEVL